MNEILSNEEAMQLLNMKKYIVGDHVINLNFERMRIDLASNEGNYKFILDIHLNKKIQFKLSLHHQEDQRKIGLLRLDYKGRHTNPFQETENLPLELKPFIGKCFDIDEPHIHRYVVGYKPLAWALPVADYGFPIGSIEDCIQCEEAISIFAKKIQIENNIIIQRLLI
jgi:hypothetical protein